MPVVTPRRASWVAALFLFGCSVGIADLQPAPGQPVDPIPGSGVLRVSCSPCQQGEAVTLTGSGFRAPDFVSLSVRGSWTSFYAEQSAFTFVWPGSLPPGQYTVSAYQRLESGQGSVEVARTSLVVQ